MNNFSIEKWQKWSMLSKKVLQHACSWKICLYNILLPVDQGMLSLGTLISGCSNTYFHGCYYVSNMAKLSVQRQQILGQASRPIRVLFFIRQSTEVMPLFKHYGYGKEEQWCLVWCKYDMLMQIYWAYMISSQLNHTCIIRFYFLSSTFNAEALLICFYMLQLKLSKKLDNFVLDSLSRDTPYLS